jgi:hypothetical protein
MDGVVSALSCSFTHPVAECVPARVGVDVLDFSLTRPTFADTHHK